MQWQNNGVNPTTKPETMNTIKIMWEKLDKNKLPKGEVLAANFKPGTYGYKEKCLGSLYLKYDEIICENEHEELGGCTHYIDIHKFDIQ